MTNSITFLDLSSGNLVCKRCGETFNLQLPQEVDFLGRVTKAFEMSHRRCKTKPPATKPDSGSTATTSQAALEAGAQEIARALATAIPDTKKS